MDSVGSKDFYVYCTNRGSKDPWILRAKLPYPIDVPPGSQITALELSLPTHWNNVTNDNGFWVYLIDNSSEVRAFVHLPPSYYRTYKKLEQKIANLISLKDNKVGKKDGFHN